MSVRYIFALLLTLSTASAQDLYRMEKSADAMGATFTVALYGTDRAAMEAAIDAALAEAQRLDTLLSNYRPESEWSAVNRGAGSKPIKVSGELFRLLAACLEYSRESDGAFDITVGPLMKIWGFYKSSGHLAPKSEVEAALDKIGYRHVHLDPAARTVRSMCRASSSTRAALAKGMLSIAWWRFSSREAASAPWWPDRIAVFTAWARRPMNCADGK